MTNREIAKACVGLLEELLGAAERRGEIRALEWCRDNLDLHDGWRLYARLAELKAEETKQGEECPK